MNNKELLGYALQYVSYVVSNLEPMLSRQIKEILLFGSVARGEATTSSDVDLFFNVPKENKMLSNRIAELTTAFYATAFCRIWRNLGIENDLQPLVGVLKDWDLKQSIIVNGIVLYGKYTAPITTGRPLVIIYWLPIKNQSTRVFLSKKLYGYSYKKRRYPGILSERSVKLSANCIAVPLVEARAVLGIFRDMKVQFKSMYVGKME